MLLPKQAQAALKVGVPFRLEEEVGLGDVIKRVTAKVGITPCAPCQARAEAMNRRVVFTGRSTHAR